MSQPICYRPNKDPYPLCIGSDDVLFFKENCFSCCLYENMDETNFRPEEWFVTLKLPETL